MIMVMIVLLKLDIRRNDWANSSSIWLGNRGYRNFKKYYPNYAHKIYKTGSPRADLWGKTFLDYWNIPSTLPNKPFLLISCNVGYANNIRTFGELIQMENDRGRFKKDSEYLRNSNWSYI